MATFSGNGTPGRGFGQGEPYNRFGPMAVRAGLGRQDGSMDTELTVALVGVGGALGGAIIGGAAAMYSASIQGKRTAEAAAKTYEGVLDAARRAAQQEAYTLLLSAANSYEEATETHLERAEALLQHLQDRSEGIPSVLDGERRARAQWTAIHGMTGPGQVMAAARRVGLEGPSIVRDAAKDVQCAAATLARVFRDLGETEGDSPLGPPLTSLDGPRRAHSELISTIERFSEIASANGGHGGAVRA